MTRTDSLIQILSGEDRSMPVFQAPWEAYAFALAVQLSEQGIFDCPNGARLSPRKSTTLEKTIKGISTTITGWPLSRNY